LGYLDSNENLKNGLKRAIEMGYRGDVETCGLHVHVDRRAFGETEMEQEVNIGKLIYLFERFWGEIVGLSRRRDSDKINRYAKRYLFNYASDYSSFDEFLRSNKNTLEFDMDRYFSVNLKNSKTVEIRIFKGTLNFDSIVGIVQFVNRLVVASNYSIEKVRKISFWGIIAPLMKKPEFESYIKNVNSKGHFKAFEELSKILGKS
jgi:hypothetical protein